MLIEFRVENHRSLRDEQVLTMESGRGGEAADPRPRQVEGTQISLLPVIAVYGANASGKTNVLLALAFMRDAVLNSFNEWGPDQEISRNAFAWGKYQHELSRFDVTFLLSGVRYEYGFCLSNTAVEEEWLFAWPNGKKQVWFEREASLFKFGDHLKGDNRIIEGVTRGNALFLSTAVQFKHQQLHPIFSWFRTIQTLNFGDSPSLPLTEHAMARLFDRQRSLFDDDLPDTMQERFLGLLRNADLGIVGLKVIPRDSSDSRRRPRFEVKHQSEVGDAWLPLTEESKGTRTLFRAGIPILQTIEQGGVLLVDELEASLHPMLAQHIVRQFNDPVTNPLNAQLIFTTHDTNLLGTTLGDPALRRDQIWFTEKDPAGATGLYPLTDFKPRKAENLERGYIQGRYGAIPFLGDFTISAE
jgi:AAA15 family ATPase/GTPase